MMPWSTVAQGTSGRLMCGYQVAAKLEHWSIEKNDSVYKTIHASIKKGSVDEFWIGHGKSFKVMLVLGLQVWTFAIPDHCVEATRQGRQTSEGGFLGYGFPEVLEDGSWKYSTIPISVDFKIPDNLAPEITRNVQKSLRDPKDSRQKDLRGNRR